MTGNIASHCRAPWLLALPIMLLWASPWVAATERLPAAEVLLHEMSAALRQLDYDGVFIYRRGRAKDQAHNHAIDTMRIIHKAQAAGGARTRLVSLSGAPREVLRNSTAVTCIFPDQRLVMVEKSHAHDQRHGGAGSPLPQSINADFASPASMDPVSIGADFMNPKLINKLRQHYDIGTTGHGRIAGHAAWLVTIRPLDAYRYGYQLWIAKDSKLLLKSTLRNRAGYPLEEIVFTQLEVSEAIPEQQLNAGVQTANYTWKYSAERLPGTDQQRQSGWQIRWMPPGFALQDHAKLAGAGDAEHLALTDGLAVVSVFIEEARPAGNISGPARIGAVNAFVRVMPGHTVTAIGEAPQATVQRLAASVAALR